ncbi:asparagine synthase-related protein [Formosa sp. A9]|uniref:asparagine synthase-related protein n=1 Tax=Formosa sp. A9 TaxID=3442641 RepID=UPI003EBCCE99
MKTVTTPIIPVQPTYAKIQAPHELHLEAICVFAATGFFLDTDTYWKDTVVLRPACEHQIDDAGYLVSSTPYFEWEYTPDETRNFERTLDQFTTLFETIIAEQTQGQRVILPLSGGLDSRTQAVALQRLGRSVQSYSYQFEGGYPETDIADAIAKICEFPFEAFQIPKGYLWNVIDELAQLNRCESDFTAPRQMAIVNQFKSMGDMFSLGHWGDVLFDDMQVADDLDSYGQIEALKKKLLKKGGLTFAECLWNQWGLAGTFAEYFHERIASLLQAIPITNSANARIRAFKSLYWAPRWTSVNLAVFASVKPISLPYYNNRMCAFICSVPERFLSKRQLQIGYIKRYAPKVAAVTWQDQKPFNLYTYTKNKAPYNVPYRIVNKLQRLGQQVLGTPYIQRNWELQFLGPQNSTALEAVLYHPDLVRWVSWDVIEAMYNGFKHKDGVQHAHAINMLVVLSTFIKSKSV